MDQTESIKKKVSDRVKAETLKGINEKEKALTSKLVLNCLHLNELGDSVIFKKKYRNHFCLNKATGDWLRFNGHHWEHDILNEVFGGVEHVAEIYANEIPKLKDDKNGNKIYQKLIRRVFQLRGTNRQNAVVTQAGRGLNSLSISGKEVDQKPYLFPCKNGVVDLETGLLTKGRPSDYLLKASPIEFHGIDTPCPSWEGALHGIFDGDEEKISYLQRILGLSLIGEVVEHNFFAFIGPGGRNGKTTIFETMKSILGPLATQIPTEMLVDTYRPQSSGPTPDLMSLKGARLVWGTETKKNDKLSPARVKWLTGGDSITARSPHDKYPTEFLPSHTLFLITNERPGIDGQDDAMWERMIHIPLELQFLNREPDPNNPRQKRAIPKLKEKIANELPGVFSWLVKGCIYYQNQGLKTPESIKASTKEYRESEDFYGAFKADCLIDDPTNKVLASEMYSTFETWFKDNLHPYPPKRHMFGKWAVSEFNDGDKDVKLGGERAYKNIRIISPYP